jgi:hypothetical protein
VHVQQAPQLHVPWQRLLTLVVELAWRKQQVRNSTSIAVAERCTTGPHVSPPGQHLTTDSNPRSSHAVSLHKAILCCDRGLVTSLVWSHAFNYSLASRCCTFVSRGFAGEYRVRCMTFVAKAINVHVAEHAERPSSDVLLLPIGQPDEHVSRLCCSIAVGSQQSRTAKRMH